MLGGFFLRGILPLTETLFLQERFAHQPRNAAPGRAEFAVRPERSDANQDPRHARALSIITFQTPLDLRTSSTASRMAPWPARAFVV